MQPARLEESEPRQELNRLTVGTVLLRALLFALLWATLTEGEGDAWLVGAPAVLAAGTASAALRSRARWRLRALGVIAFVPFFLWRSLLGSIDVAWRAFHPALPITPSFEVYPLRLPRGAPARVFFANAVNLLPGTLCAEMHEDSLTIHVLSGGTWTRDRLGDLEEKIAAMFGLELSEAAVSPERPASRETKDE